MIRLRIILFLVLLVFSVSSQAQEKSWLGRAPQAEWTFGVLGGIGEFNGEIGFAPLTAFAKKVAHQGFAPDINNQVFVEAEVGPLFILSSAAFLYSLHLRWDFVFDRDWTFYALGGLGGLISGSDLGNAWRLYPRFGIGSFFQITEAFGLRGELSHEFIGAGVTYRI